MATSDKAISMNNAERKTSYLSNIYKVLNLGTINRLLLLNAINTGRS